MNHEGQVQNAANYDLICHLAQQCTEKYLKGRLVEAEIDFPKTHNLTHLLTLLLPIEPEWEVLKPSLLGLKAFGVSIIYPGKKAGKADAQAALRFCRTVCDTARRSLGLPI